MTRLPSALRAIALTSLVWPSRTRGGAFQRGPDNQGSVIRSGDGALPSGTDGHRANLFGVAIKGTRGRVGIEVPDTHRPVIRA